MSGQALHKVFNILFFLILLFAAIPTLALTLYAGFHLTSTKFSVQPFLFLFLLPLLLFLPILFVLLKVAKALLTGKKIFNKNHVFSFTGYMLVLLLSLSVIGFVGYGAWELTHDKPPRFFPLDDTQATYTIIERSGRYYVLFESKSDKNVFLECTSNAKGEKHCVIEVIVGKSDTALEPFVGKKVRISGDFVRAHQQCIARVCQDIGSWVGLDIYEIEEL